MNDNTSTTVNTPSVNEGQFKKNHKKRGGRKKGTPNINTEIHKGAMGRIRDRIVESGGTVKTPAEFLVDVYNDPQNKMSDRVTAAKIVATIIHPNAPKQLNVKGGVKSSVEFTLLASDAHNNLERLVNANNKDVVDGINEVIEGEVVDMESESNNLSPDIKNKLDEL